MSPLVSTRTLRIALAVVAMAGLCGAWWLYPAGNHYSIVTCTISYLGSPDPDRNPAGWRIYQVGMTSLILLMGSLLRDRHAQFVGTRALVARLATIPLVLALSLLLASVWIPDSRWVVFLGHKATRVHTQLAILAIPVMGLGLTLDTVGRFILGTRLLDLWPAFLFAVLFVVGFWNVSEWERLCRLDPTLKHWPGDGIHSTPLWEWILFVCLNGHFVWMSRPSPTRPEPNACKVN